MIWVAACFWICFFPFSAKENLYISQKRRSQFVHFFGSLLQVTRMDGALEHMRQFGFCDQLVGETVKELLKVGFYLFVFCFC